MSNVCGCKRGYASDFDDLCRDCRGDRFQAHEKRRAGLKRNESVPIYKLIKFGAQTLFSKGYSRRQVTDLFFEDLRRS